ncbi:MAG: hypothetical protein GY862_29930 [Gammaproteobacteria bacterium]|nr:hypothetical protein [Gammaproteobacteria bacterium]
MEKIQHYQLGNRLLNGQRKMDKNTIEAKLEKIEDTFIYMQKPMEGFYDALDKLIDSTKGTKSIALSDFTIELSVLMEKFANEMVDTHTELIDAMEEVEALESQAD